jgi:type II secretory pathway pseudopilin PulG
MPWGVVAAAVIGGVASYASAQSAEDAAQDSAEAELEAQKELLQMKRDFELEDRKYRQDAVGNWSKFADPKLAPATYGENATPSQYNRTPAFQGARPGFGGAAPSSMSSFKNRNPEYDFFKRPPEQE